MSRSIRYAPSGDFQIAYDVFGAGPHDLVFVHGWVTHVELLWEHPRVARALERLGSFCRVINFDSAIVFESRGDHELAGLPGTWALYATR